MVGCGLGDAVGSTIDIVGTAVGGELVGIATVAVDDGGGATDSDVGVDTGAQAVMKIATRMNTMI